MLRRVEAGRGQVMIRGPGHSSPNVLRKKDDLR